jgi:hypothetical protein
MAQPALSAGEVKDAVTHIRAARAMQAKAALEQKAKAEQGRKPGELSSVGATASAGTPGTPAGPTPTQSSSPTPGQGTGGAPAQRRELSGGQVGSIIGGIVVVLLLLFVWLFVRRKLSAHAIVERYALFLSTLSYQHIRALRALESGTAADRLSHANDDLSHYLRFIRGGGTYIAKAKAADLPVRLEPDLDLATFLSAPRNII